MVRLFGLQWYYIYLLTMSSLALKLTRLRALELVCIYGSASVKVV